tara:strand:+ start:1682 stop:3151 length:1470 start_codon:yes stop_codon:yes gene_type:complete
MTWGALLQTVGKGVAKKVSGAAKKKGSEMAKKIVNKKEESKQSAIVIREKSTALIPISKADGEEDSSIQKSESSSSPLERIRSTLLDIIETLKKRRKLVLDRSRKDRVQADKIKKGKREGLLEKMKSGGKKMLSNVAAAASGWWERLQKFLLMTMLGALVLAIKNNWETIQEKIKETVEFVKVLWENLEPILTPIWKGLMWVVKWVGGKVYDKLMKISKEQEEVKEKTDEVSKSLEKLDEKTKWGRKLFETASTDIKSIKDTSSEDIFAFKQQIEEDDTSEQTMTLVSSSIASEKENINRFKEENLTKFDQGAVPVVETGPAIVHRGEVIVPAPIVQMAGGPMNIQNVINMMSLSNGNNIKDMMESTSGKIKENPFQLIDIMQGMAQEFAPIGEQLPGIINETIGESKIGGAPAKILEKMEKTLTILKEQTGYEDPSGTTIFIPLPPSNQSSSNGGGNGGSGTNMVTVGDSTAATLNKYREALIKAALY